MRTSFTKRVATGLLGLAAIAGLAGSATAQVTWYSNDGSENFTRIPIDTDTNGGYYVSAVDVDGDTDLDVLWVDDDCPGDVRTVNSARVVPARKRRYAAVLPSPRRARIDREEDFGPRRLGLGRVHRCEWLTVFGELPAPHSVPSGSR